VLQVPPHEVKCVTGFFGNDVYIMAPFKVITEYDSKVFGIFHSLNGCITEFIFLDVWKSGTVNCHYIPLGGIEMYAPTLAKLSSAIIPHVYGSLWR